MAFTTDYKSVPIFINARDLVTPLQRLVNWLLEANYRTIYILDNDSSYPPLLDFYSRMRKELTVIQLGANIGHTAFWDLQLAKRLQLSTPYVYTDPDIVPIDECPSRFLEFFLEVLQTFPHKTKVGFGLVISDLPDHYRWKQKVITWESQFWEKRLTPTLYDAPIDTTFALYRPGSPYDLSGIRSGFPYLARHYPWYENTDAPSTEQLYYTNHAKPGTNNWSGAQLPAWLDNLIQQRASHANRTGA
jgi:hypothetical protein